MTIRAAGGGIALAALLAACDGSSSSAAPATRSRLPSGFVARIGADLVSTGSVSRIAAAQGVPPPEALERAASDALWAEAARRSAPVGIANHIERAALARSVLEQLARDAASGGPPSEAELGEVARERWLELERPDAVRTTHAVVLDQQSGADGAARRAAEKVAEAVKSATSAEEFARLAKGVPLDGLELQVEPLPAVSNDGRTFEQREGTRVARGTFDRDFARAANALTVVGQLSPVTRTKFGFHVIRLEERVPGNVVPKSELPKLLAADVVARRAARAKLDLVDQLRKGVIIERDRGIDELTARAKVTP
jgi:peptidyl-prolyl cis-trans isomerase C